MRHLKKFESIDTYNITDLEPLINWDNINYIKEKLSEYEDRGINVSIGISHPDEDVTAVLIDVYHTKDDGMVLYPNSYKVYVSLKEVMEKGTEGYYLNFTYNEMNVIHKYLKDVESRLSRRFELAYNGGPSVCFKLKD